MPSNARSSRGRDRRLQIIDAARDLLQESHRIPSLRDIAQRAGISHVGLLRHYATTADVLMGLLEWHAPSVDELIPVAPPTPGTGLEVPLARREMSLLLTVLAAEASTPDHSAHERLSVRRGEARARVSAYLRVPGRLGAGRDPDREAARLVALWDGLQVIELYAPELLSGTELPDYLERLAKPQPEPSAPWPQPVPAPEPAPTATDSRREQIVQIANDLFGRRGFAGTSLQEIARGAGIAKATLFHYFPSKEALLQETLDQREVLIDDGIAALAQRCPAQAILTIAARTVAMGQTGTLHHAVLICEATPPQHPAHAFFAGRLRSTLTMLGALFGAAASNGELHAGRDARTESLVFVAMWTGLEVQQCYAPDGEPVDVALAAHLATVLTPLPPEEANT